MTVCFMAWSFGGPSPGTYFTGVGTWARGLWFVHAAVTNMIRDHNWLQHLHEILVTSAIVCTAILRDSHALSAMT